MVMAKKPLPKLRVSSKPSLKYPKIDDVKYAPPQNGIDGIISFRLNDRIIANKIQLISAPDIRERVARWDAIKDVVYATEDMPHKYLKWLGIHESLEKHYVQNFGYSEEKAHDIVEVIEKREFLRAGHTPKEWKNYSAHVDFVSALGGKSKPTATYPTGRNVPKIQRKIQMLPVSQLTPRELKPVDLPRRTAHFVQMIKAKQPISPILAYKDEQGNWKIHDGCARHNAFKELKIEKIPAVVLEA
jgi:hypothetical protein